MAISPPPRDFTRVLKITLQGLDPRAQTTLEMFLKGPALSLCEVTPEATAEAAIFDLDGLGGMQLWLTFRERFHGPAIVLSVTEKQLHNAVWVRKPLNSKDFIAALDLIKQRLQTERRLQALAQVAEGLPAPTIKPAPLTPIVPPIERRIVTRPAPQATLPAAATQPEAAVKSEPPVQAESVSRAASLAWTEQQAHEFCGVIDDSMYLNPDRRRELFYDPEGYLQGLLQRAYRQAHATHSPTRLEAIGNAMAMLPEEYQVISEIREPVLRALCIRPIPEGQSQLKRLNAAELPRLAPNSPYLHSYDNMLWVITLLCARGRVPQGTDLEALVVLHSWPNFPRILVPPYGMQIAALWMTRPTALMQTAKLLGIPYRYVFAMYSGCHALDLLELSPVAKPEADPKLILAPTPTPLAAEKRSLLGNLLRKLRLTA